jgi:hypothetical protein
MIKRVLCAAAVCTVLATPCFSEEKVRIAVMDLQAKGVPETLASTVSALVRSEIVNTGLFTVVEREQINEIMKEQGLQMTGCTEQACAVQMGRLLSARKMLVGELNAAGGSFVATIRIVDVELGVSEFAADETAVSADDIPRASKAIAAKLTEKIQEKLTGDQMRAGWTPSGYYMRAIVPGWAQIYVGRPGHGWTIIGLQAASIGFSAYAVMDFMKKKKAYDDLQRGSAEFDTKFDAYDKASTMAYLSFGVVGFVYLLNWLDALFLTKPDFGAAQKEARLNDERYFFSLNLAPGFLEKNLAEARLDAGVGFRF